MSRLWRLLLTTTIIVITAAAPVGAAEQLTIRKVDTSAFPEVRVHALFTGPRPDLTEVSVRENGRLVEFDQRRNRWGVEPNLLGDGIRF